MEISCRMLEGLNFSLRFIVVSEQLRSLGSNWATQRCMVAALQFFSPQAFKKSLSQYRNTDSIRCWKVPPSNSDVLGAKSFCLINAENGALSGSLINIPINVARPGFRFSIPCLWAWISCVRISSQPSPFMDVNSSKVDSSLFHLSGTAAWSRSQQPKHHPLISRLIPEFFVEFRKRLLSKALLLPLFRAVIWVLMRDALSQWLCVLFPPAVPDKWFWFWADSSVIYL
jgi:hypothetical protein